METKIYLSDEIAEKWKKLAMERFGYGRGSISKAAEEALAFWIETEQKIRNTFSKLVKIAYQNVNVDALLIFGSYARKQIYRDIDVAIILDNDFPRADYLKVVADFEREIPECLNADVNIFNSLDLEMKSKILSEGIVLFERDREKLFELTTKVIIQYSDFKPLLESVLGE